MKDTKKETTRLAWCDPHAEQNKTAHYIRFIPAATYAWEYISRFPDFAINEGGCVEIYRDQIKDLEKVAPLVIRCGLLAYFIDDGSRFKLAWKLTSNLDDSKTYFPLPKDEDGVDYNISVCHHPYAPNEISSQISLINAILNYPKVCAEGHSTIKGININSKALIFKNKINSVVSGTIDEPIAFFHRNQIVDVLKQNDAESDTMKRCIGVRIYWGYDTIESRNKIKLVIFGIDGYGKNIPADYKILERSWPPY